jgi:hypothetical protein
MVAKAGQKARGLNGLSVRRANCFLHDEKQEHGLEEKFARRRRSNTLAPTRRKNSFNISL